MIYILNFANHIFYTACSPDDAIFQVKCLIEHDGFESDDFEIILLDDGDYGWKRFDNFEDFYQKWGNDENWERRCEL